MEIPKEIKDYCKKCGKHTLHKLKQFRANKARGLAAGTRRHERHASGYGGKYQFPALIKKQTKRGTFIAECTVCGTKHYFIIPKRMKKISLKQQ